MTTTKGTRQSLERALARLLEDVHGKEVEDLHVHFLPDRMEKVRDTWVIPVTIGDGPGDSKALNDLLRTIRQSLESKTSSSVSILIDPDLEETED